MQLILNKFSDMIVSCLSFFFSNRCQLILMPLWSQTCALLQIFEFNTFEKGLEFSLFSKKLNASKGGK